MDKIYYLFHRTTHVIMKSSISLNTGGFILFPESDNDTNDLSFDTSNDDENKNGVNYNIEEY